MSQASVENIEVTECPYYLISRASLVVTAALRRALSQAGVGQVRPAYLGVLMSLWQQDGLKVVDLGRRAGLEPSTMTGLLDRMERDGLLARSTDPDDRRVLRIHLTDEGSGLRSSVNTVVDRALTHIMEGVSEADLANLKEVLRRVLANAHKLSEP